MRPNEAHSTAFGTPYFCRWIVLTRAQPEEGRSKTSLRAIIAASLNPAAVYSALVSTDLWPLVERIFRYTYMLATHKRDELIREGRGGEMDKLVDVAKELQDSLQSGDAE